ncbi:uncharacterized protein K452DRAFT_298266 [Aplosporella prunicola CBS 121167]|uniref:Uncharacterized protein n=1 Tax=Aplosporella prunicola CBS 121167 TaxID=1176127 RepID=A0A6A6BE66_9PEZI|nr:uncharacterized protein K452DRAFT_298266 [Aplosporella prunicola CBS 121167]KAF2141554.1 hypothetical protein K452DRAFT_298266 [Aplosporella prunicola CBS 121167]
MRTLFLITLTALLLSSSSTTHALPAPQAPAEFIAPIEITKDVLIQLPGNIKTQPFGGKNCYGRWNEAKRCRKAVDGTFVPRTFVVASDDHVWQCCFDGSKIPIFPGEGLKGKEVLKQWEAGEWDV